MPRNSHIFDWRTVAAAFSSPLPLLRLLHLSRSLSLSLSFPKPYPTVETASYINHERLTSSLERELSKCTFYIFIIIVIIITSRREKLFRYTAQTQTVISRASSWSSGSSPSLWNLLNERGELLKKLDDWQKEFESIQGPAGIARCLLNLSGDNISARVDALVRKFPETQIQTENAIATLVKSFLIKLIPVEKFASFIE